MKTLLFVLSVIWHLSNASIILDTLQKCDLQNKRSRTQINTCLKDIVAAVRVENRQGTGPKWGLLRLEPLPIGDVRFQRNEGSVNIDGNFTNVLLHGVSNYSITDINARYEERNAIITAVLPTLTAEGTYVLKGNLLLVPIEGNGEFQIKLDDIGIHITAKIVANKENPEVLGIEDAKAQLKIGKATTVLGNLFPNDAVLDETIHHLINTNDQLILSQILPNMETRVSRILSIAIDRVFRNIPVKAVYQDGII